MRISFQVGFDSSLTDDAVEALVGQPFDFNGEPAVVVAAAHGDASGLVRLTVDVDAAGPEVLGPAGPCGYSFRQPGCQRTETQ